jgi:alpha,alpha-trehalase
LEISLNTREWLRALLLLAATCGVAAAQAVQAPAATQPINQYIHQSWDTLGRSMSECASVADSKVTTRPILYLPAGMATPPAVAAMQKQCDVQVEHLPRKIAHMGDVRVSEIPKEGLLYLPNRYVVPGGRFNEMYGWDSYFILLGLVQDGRVPLAQGIVENFFFEIANYGAILNANRTYYFTRSQPPLLSSMISAVYARTHDTKWLAMAYSYAQRDYALWTSAPHHAGDTGLARYDDLGSGPVPEMADDSTYYPDVVRWLLAHPEVKTDYLVPASEHPDAHEAAELSRTSCDIATSKVCAAAYANGHRLRANFFHGDRAMRESGFDTSFRFGPFSGSTEDYAPVGLNSLLYKYAMDMASFAATLGHPQDETMWKQRAAARKTAVNKYLWHADKSLFHDFNFVTGKPSAYNYLTTFYPLWAGLATPAQAEAVAGHINLFEHEGGLAMSDNDSGTQWDLPFGWAPTNWFAIDGLEKYGFHTDAVRLATQFEQTVRTNYQHDGTIREKYNVVSGDANVRVATGYKSNVIGFGWTNGVYVSLEALLPQAQSESPVALSVTPGPAAILTHDELDKIVPATVFFKGQTATVQVRNAAGLRFGDGSLVFAVKVDSGGYASNIQERYQDYLITEVPLRLGTESLAAGAYGMGFLNGNLVVMNLGGLQIFETPAVTNLDLKRPTPLQILPDITPGQYRLYSGRSYVVVARVER